MPSKFRLRKPFKPVVTVLSKMFIKLGVSPNMATGLMLTCSIVAIVILEYSPLLWLFGLFIFITGLMDGVDGSIARMTGEGSEYGGFFDSTMDRISEMILFMGMVMNVNQFFIFPDWAAIILMWISLVSSYMISYTRARTEIIAHKNEVSYDTDVGLFARSERLFYLFLTFTIGHFVGIVFINYALVVFTFGVLSTFIYRVLTYKKVLTKDE